VISFKLIGASVLIQKLQDPTTITKPLDNGIKRLTLQIEALVKRATVVDTGRLRASVTHQIEQREAWVGTNVQYAQYVEYGTHKMAARHMEGGSKVFGKGMFTYALEQIRKILGKEQETIAKDIQEGFE
jgi:phage gpG-like protein